MRIFGDFATTIEGHDRASGRRALGGSKPARPALRLANRSGYWPVKEEERLGDSEPGSNTTSNMRWIRTWSIRISSTASLNQKGVP